MAKPVGLLGRVTRAFWLQVALITLAALLGIYFAKIVVEENLVENAILDEVDYFWQDYERDGRVSKDGVASLPNTRNLKGYFDTTEMPASLRQDLPQTLGFHEFEDAGKRMILHISSREDKNLYLVFHRGQVDDLVLYYGLFPLLTVLIILYLTLWLTYRFSHRSITPVARLANHINQVDFNDDHLSLELRDPSFDGSEEIRILVDALSRLGDRLNSFIARERNFSRDASHEFRSPLTVINMATDMMLLDDRVDPSTQTALYKIKRAVDDMESLTEVFLMLAREDAGSISRMQVDVNQVVREQVERVEFLREQRNIKIQLREQGRLEVFSSETVIAVVLGNLLRNALLHSGCGDVTIDVDERQLAVSDNGPGIPSDEIDRIFQPYHRAANDNASGFGIGLTIVKRLCDRFDWQIEVDSVASRGTSFRLVFGDVPA